jgi:hypothetical protein
MLTTATSARTLDLADDLTPDALAIDAAERRCRAALRDLARLIRSGEISLQDAADLERDALARLTGYIRAIAAADPPLWEGCA